MKANIANNNIYILLISMRPDLYWNKPKFYIYYDNMFAFYYNIVM